MILIKPGRLFLRLCRKSALYMGFYDLPKDERMALAMKIHDDLASDCASGDRDFFIHYFSNPDTYIRKNAYLAAGRIFSWKKPFRTALMHTLDLLMNDERFHVRQTVVNSAGEIGKGDFGLVRRFFDKGLFDPHHTVRNAVIGSVKKMGEVNPGPVLEWAREYLHHDDKEIRREICHGIELRGRKYPQDILPLLKTLQFDRTARVRNTLVHVLGQIAYKKGCLPTVIKDLQNWENKDLVKDAVEEIIDVHHRYRNFSALTQEQARAYIRAEGFQV